VTQTDPADELDNWRQGDIAAGEVHFSVMSLPDDSGDDMDVYSSDGAVLLTQSCDIVRSYERKPFVQVAALRRVTHEEMARIKLGREPRFLFVPALEARLLVADLDLVMTLDKRALVTRDRTPGCTSDLERRTLAAVLARHRQRYAFPDEFNDALRPLRRWIEGKAGKASDAGRFVDAIKEIRVRTTSWENPDEIEFICVLKDDCSVADRQQWTKELLKGLQDRTKSAWCPSCLFRLTTYDEMLARDLVESDRLDLEGLSDA
jgi:hypothetical protein